MRLLLAPMVFIVIDEAVGAIVGFVRFGDNGLPDTRLFRIEDDQIRYVHTLTVCFEPHCGFDLPERLREQ